MRKSLITITLKVEATLPDNVSATEFTKDFPLNGLEYDSLIVSSKFEEEIFLEIIPS